MSSAAKNAGRMRVGKIDSWKSNGESSSSRRVTVASARPFSTEQMPGCDVPDTVARARVLRFRLWRAVRSNSPAAPMSTFRMISDKVLLLSRTVEAGVAPTP